MEQWLTSFFFYVIKEIYRLPIKSFMQSFVNSRYPLNRTDLTRLNLPCKQINKHASTQNNLRLVKKKKMISLQQLLDFIKIYLDLVGIQVNKTSSKQRFLFD